MGAIRTADDIRNFVRGCAIMGTGGGGATEEAIRWLEGAIADGHTLQWVSAEDVEDQSWTACPFLMGSIAPLTDAAKRKMEELGLSPADYKSIQARSIQLLEEYMDVKISAVVAGETGAGSCAGTVAAAARLGVAAVDGDYCGRAVPESIQTTPYLSDLPLWPLACADRYGNLSVIKDCTSYAMAERLGKFIASASFGLAGEAGFVFRGCDMKRVVVRGTLSRALEVGRTVQSAQVHDQDAVRALLKETGGWLLLEGVVTGKETEDRDGYYWGTHTIEGSESSKGKTLKIWFQNENHMSWLNGETYITSPDVITVLERETGEPVLNPDLQIGAQVAVVGLRAPQPFRSARGLSILGPSHFGFAADYVPIEERLG